MIDADPILKAKAEELRSNQSLIVEERSAQLVDFINSRSDEMAFTELMKNIRKAQSQKKKPARKPTRAQIISHMKKFLIHHDTWSVAELKGKLMRRKVYRF